MSLSLVPGWSAAQLEAHACLVLDRRGFMVCFSQALGRLTGTTPVPLGTPPRRLRVFPDPTVQPAIENWVAFIVSGALNRLAVSSGEIVLPRRAGGTLACRWQYFGIPPSDPDYHLLLYEPIDDAAPEALARRALRMERALFEIQSIVDGVGLGEPRREMHDPVDLAALTERELDVAKLLLDGNSNERIARQLRVSIETVKSHAKAIFRKLAVHSRAELLSRFVHRSLGWFASILAVAPSFA